MTIKPQTEFWIMVPQEKINTWGKHAEESTEPQQRKSKSKKRSHNQDLNNLYSLFNTV
jgi:hypothetical protein